MRELTDQEKSYILIDSLSSALKNAGLTRYVEGISTLSGNNAGALYDRRDKIIKVFNLANKTIDNTGRNLRHEVTHNVVDINKTSNTEKFAQEVANGRTLDLDTVDPQYLESFISGNISPYRESYNQPTKEDLISMRQREMLLKNLNNLHRIIRHNAIQKGTDPYTTPVSDVYLGDVEAALNTYSYPDYYSGLPQRNDATVDEALAYTQQGENSYKAWQSLLLDLGLPKNIVEILKPNE